MGRVVVTLPSGAEVVVDEPHCAALLEVLAAGGLLAGARRGELRDAEHALALGSITYVFSPREFEVVRYLWRYRGGWVSRGRLLRDVFGAHVSYDPSIVRMHILNIRRKLGADASVLRTDRAAGAMLAIDVDDELTNAG